MLHINARKLLQVFPVLAGLFLLCIWGLSTSRDKEITIPDAEDHTTSVREITSSKTGETNTSSGGTTITRFERQSKVESSKILSANPNFEEVRYYLLGTATDPLYGSSWYHTQTQTSRAWDLTTGSSNVKVAVIDSGFALNHEDLSDRWATNSGEMGLTEVGERCWDGGTKDKKQNSCDDDGNGYLDDWRGYDFFNEDNDVTTGTTNPDGSATFHGSMVAGMIGASVNNSKGSAGIDQSAEVMPLQVFSDDGEAYTSDIVRAIEYAADNGARVINLSLGSNRYDTPMLLAIRYANTKGAVVVAASGNCALNDEPLCNDLSGPGRMTYPALYTEVLAVGATNQSQQRSSFSSYGPMLDLVAPGQSVGPLPYYTSGNSTSGYASASGTSFSSPLVAGIASLLIAQNPTVTPEQIAYILTTSADKTVAMSTNNSFDTQYGYGIANAHRATLLGLARTQDYLLGTRELSPNEPSIGKVWRAKSGGIAADESILIGCRVVVGELCSASVKNVGLYPYVNKTSGKADPLQYIFIKGSEVPSGTWQISVHNNSYASLVTTLTR